MAESAKDREREREVAIDQERTLRVACSALAILVIQPALNR